jgi:hypothetical protein
MDNINKLVFDEVNRIIDEDILNVLNGGEPNPDIIPMLDLELETILVKTIIRFKRQSPEAKNGNMIKRLKKLYG